jgi:hypothetical protein
MVWHSPAGNRFSGGQALERYLQRFERGQVEQPDPDLGGFKVSRRMTAEFTTRGEFKCD